MPGGQGQNDLQPFISRLAVGCHPHLAVGCTDDSHDRHRQDLDESVILAAVNARISSVSRITGNARLRLEFHGFEKYAVMT